MFYHFNVASCLQVENLNVLKYTNKQNMVSQTTLSFALNNM